MTALAARVMTALAARVMTALAARVMGITDRVHLATGGSPGLRRDRWCACPACCCTAVAVHASPPQKPCSRWPPRPSRTPTGSSGRPPGGGDSRTSPVWAVMHALTRWQACTKKGWWCARPRRARVAPAGASDANWGRCSTWVSPAARRRTRSSARRFSRRRRESFAETGPYSPSAPPPSYWCCTDSRGTGAVSPESHGPACPTSPHATAEVCEQWNVGPLPRALRDS